MRKRERFSSSPPARGYTAVGARAVLALRRVHPQTLARAGCRTPMKSTPTANQVFQFQGGRAPACVTTA